MKVKLLVPMVMIGEVGFTQTLTLILEGTENYKTTITRLIDLYPKSTGVRFHSLSHNAHCILHLSKKVFCMTRAFIIRTNQTRFMITWYSESSILKFQICNELLIII